MPPPSAPRLVILWYRATDLRIDDHPALRAAVLAAQRHSNRFCGSTVPATGVAHQDEHAPHTVLSLPRRVLVPTGRDGEPALSFAPTLVWGDASRSGLDSRVHTHRLSSPRQIPVAPIELCS